MDWKREAIDKLRCYNARKNAITTITQEILRLEDEFDYINTAGADGALRCEGGTKAEDVLLTNAAHRGELKRSLRQAEAAVEIVDKGLAVLDDTERLILDRFYISPAKGNVDRLCEELFLEKSAVYDRKDKAVRRFTIAMYGVVET